MTWKSSVLKYVSQTSHTNAAAFSYPLSMFLPLKHESFREAEAHLLLFSPGTSAEGGQECSSPHQWPEAVSWQKHLTPVPHLLVSSLQQTAF